MKARECRALLGGAPDVIHGMKYGGTRYKFNHGIFIDHVERDGMYYVAQAGVRGAVAKERTLARAMARACRWYRTPGTAALVVESEE
jgi:hypothetical protein